MGDVLFWHLLVQLEMPRYAFPYRETFFESIILGVEFDFRKITDESGVLRSGPEKLWPFFKKRSSVDRSDWLRSP